MRSLARMSMVELQEAIRKDPAQRAAAWEEIRFRNQSRQAFERENGYQCQPLPENVQRWFAPDLSDPEPPREGPLV